MSEKPPKGPWLRRTITTRLIRGTGPVNRLRARRFGLEPVLGRPPELELYYEPGDPHSHLCAQLLPTLARRLKTRLRVRIVGSPQAEAYPEAEKQRRFALVDSARIAPAWGLHFPDNAGTPAAARKLTAARILCGADDLSQFVARERDVAGALFAGDVSALESMTRKWNTADAKTARRRLDDNAARRDRLGHYLPAMWQFDGEWFWSLDRLPHLERRLRAKRLLENASPLADFQPRSADLPRLESPLPALEFFFSFRSPYSYLAAVQLHQARKHLPVKLRVRPVLPMAMRGMKIPLSKALYIPRDVYREATDLGLPFGPMHDPLGEATERCLTVFNVAGSARQQLDYLMAAAKAIWTEAVDLTTDAGMRYVCERAGIDWPRAEEKLHAGMDLEFAEENRNALFRAGLWGVPSFKLGEFATWGRDRLWMVHEVIRRSTP